MRCTIITTVIYFIIKVKNVMSNYTTTNIIIIIDTIVNSVLASFIIITINTSRLPKKKQGTGRSDEGEGMCDGNTSRPPLISPLGATGDALLFVTVASHVIRTSKGR